MIAGERDSPGHEPLQGPANDGGIPLNSQQINMGTSLPHPKEHPKSSTENHPGPVENPTSSHPKKESQSVDLDLAQQAAVDATISKLPRHVEPLFESIKRQGHSPEVERAMRSELAFLCLTKWKPRLDLWVKTHRPNEVPPIVFHGGFAWVTRKERRRQDRRR